MTILTTLPKNLTFKEWEAKKGVIAKMAGETGMGAALKKLDAAWAKIPWDKIEPTTAWNKYGTPGKPATLAGMQALMKDVPASIAKVEPTRKELVAVRDLATSLEKKWKSSKVIPASSTKYVAEMAKTADQLFIALKSLDNEWKTEIDRLKVSEARLQGIAIGVIKPYFKSLVDNAKEVRANPTVATYVGGAGKGFHQNIRGLNAALERSKNDQWIAWKERNWKPLSQDSFKPTSDDQVLPKVDEVLTALRELHQMVG